MHLLGFTFAILVGISLGLIGSGGSILTVPILVYIIGIEPAAATAYSLFIVGSTALVGGLQNAFQKNIDFKTVLVFGIPSITTVYMTRLWLIPIIPDQLFSIGHIVFTKSIVLMLLFASIMMLASFSMIRPSAKNIVTPKDDLPYNYLMILRQGLFVGLLAGLVGAGGGFLIIPALVMLAKIPMRKAIGTSLFIIAAQSLIGFTGDLQGNQIIDWKLLTVFTLCSVTGIFIGNFASKFVSGAKLKTSFGWFILVMGIYIFLREAVLKH